MENKYLTKLAGIQERIRQVISDHDHRHEEIEEPINRMYAGIDAIENEYSEDPYAQAAALANVHSAVKFMAEPMMRRNLGIDQKHEENTVGAGVKLLALKEIDYKPSLHEAKGIIRRLKEVPTESNGYVGLRNLGTVGASVAGAVGGGMLGNKFLGHPGALVGAVGGSVAGLIGGGYALSSLMKDTIKDRQEEIYEIREQDVHKAYDTIRARLGI